MNILTVSAQGHRVFSDSIDKNLWAEFERYLLKERQREGIALAKKRGVYRGRKRSLSTEQIIQLKQRADAGEKKAALAREFGISRDTVYQYLRSAQ